MEKHISMVRTIRSQKYTINMRPKCYKKDLLRFSLNTTENYRELTKNWSLLMKMNNKLLMMLISLSLFKNNPLDNAKLMLDFTIEVLWIIFNLNVLKILKKKWKNQKLIHLNKSTFLLINVSNILEKYKNFRKATNGTVLHVRNTNRPTRNSEFTKHLKFWFYI